MRKAVLPEREKEICKRLRELREKLGLSELAASERVGISRDRWHNYEMLRSPLKCDVALRICRQLIVSEEWLATGAFRLAEKVALERKIGLGPELHIFYFRQCVDLQSEPEYIDLIAGRLYGDAFDNILAPKYEELVRKFFQAPRIIFRDSDTKDLIIAYLNVLAEAWLVLLDNEAKRLQKSSGFVRRSFLRHLMEYGEVLFKKFMGFPTPEIEGPDFNFLRAMAQDSVHPFGPLHGDVQAQSEAPKKGAELHPQPVSPYTESDQMREARAKQLAKYVDENIDELRKKYGSNSAMLQALDYIRGKGKSRKGKTAPTGQGSLQLKKAMYLVGRLEPDLMPDSAIYDGPFPGSIEALGHKL